MASGASIHELNRARGERSALKGGKLARLADAPITTLVVSDVFDDDLATIGSGPTFPPREHDRIELVAPMWLAADAMYDLVKHRERVMQKTPMSAISTPCSRSSRAGCAKAGGGPKGPRNRSDPWGESPCGFPRTTVSAVELSTSHCCSRRSWPGRRSQRS